MTGASIVGTLLRAYAPLIALVPEQWIKLGTLPAKVELPALLVRTVSSIERQTLQRGAFVRTIDRVSVLVRAENYSDQVAAMKLVRACCAGRTGDIGGGLRVSILSAGTGPDIAGPNNSFDQTQDFRVSFDAPA